MSATATASSSTPTSQSGGGGGGGVTSPALNLDVFEHDYFNADTFVKKIAAESVYSSSIADTKEKLNRSAQQTAEEIKQSVYKNYTNFMDTAKEVGHLEGKMNQMRQSLDEQRKLLNLFTNLNINSATNNLNLNDATSNAAKTNDK